MNLGRVKARIIDDRKLIRIALIRINLRSLRSIDSTELSRWPKFTFLDRSEYIYRVRVKTSLLTAPASSSLQPSALPMCLHMGCFDVGFACCKSEALALSKEKFLPELGINFYISIGRAAPTIITFHALLHELCPLTSILIIFKRSF